jgi:hypothetical protein
MSRLPEEAEIDDPERLTQSSTIWLMRINNHDLFSRRAISLAAMARKRTDVDFVGNAEPRQALRLP